MKNLILFVLIILAAVLSYQKSEQIREFVYRNLGRPLPQSTITSKPSPPSQPNTGSKKDVSETGASSNLPSRPTLESLEKLPENQYYSRRRLSQITENGVQAIPEGTLVIKTGEENGLIIVTDGRSSVKTDPINLTRTPSEILTLLK